MEFQEFVSSFQRASSPGEAKRAEERAQEPRKSTASALPGGHSRDEDVKSIVGFVPCSDQWSPKVKDLLSVEVEEEDK